MQVVIIGSGNTATVLGKLIQQSGHQIVQVMSNTLQHAQTLATQLNTTASNNFQAINQNADVYIIAVSDNAVASVAERLQLPGRLVVHTAGSTSKEILKNVSAQYGVLWPLQTLRKETAHIPAMPFIIDGNDEATINNIKSFAATLSTTIEFADDDDRQKLHLAAVMASNFTNHFYALAEYFCEKESLDFKLIVPLIIETAERIRQTSPADVQTGPAARTDIVTIDKHLKLLDSHPYLKRLYLRISNSIMETVFKK